MSTPEFFESQYTYESYAGGQNTVMVRGIKCNFREVKCKYIGSKSVKDAADANKTPYFGVNATFFGWINQRTLSYGINVSDGQEIMFNGLQQRNGTDNDVGKKFYCGTFVVLKKTTNGLMSFCDRIYDITNHTYSDGSVTYPVQLSNISLAIGGTSLFANETLTAAQYHSRLTGSGIDNGEDPPPYDSRLPRTAIVYYGGSTSGNNMALLTVHDTNCTAISENEYKTGTGGITLYDLRGLVKYFGEQFGPSGVTISNAIALDGSASSEIAAKVNGVRKTWQATSFRRGEEEYNRSVHMMLTVDM